MFWSLYCSIYTWIKNKFYFLWMYQEFNYEYIKVINCFISFTWASVCAYPFYYVREMVDLWPKERGGHCTFNNSYRQAIKWQVENMDVHFYNYLPGYWSWVKRYGFLYLGALYCADSMGMMTNCNETFNGLESQFPIFSESS
jgi:hypothetical protein